jgi:hypothetical protein
MGDTGRDRADGLLQSIYIYGVPILLADAKSAGVDG